MRASRRRGITRREFQKRALAASLGAAFDLGGTGASTRRPTIAASRIDFG
ncbi:MAG: hypothetical protein HYS05_08480 [Acidobacteria bacterium]|nr:hypothetical protein [Acidobacteriota bacterium]